MDRKPLKRQALDLIVQRGINIGTVLDVGVLTGTTELAQAFPHTEHLLFEPVIEFRPAVESNYRTIRHRFINVAVSDVDGEVTLEVNTAFPGMPISHSSMKEGEASGTNQRRVTMVTLDKYLSENPAIPPYLLKIDIDGQDLRVVTGAAQTLKQTSVIIIEIPFHTVVQRISALEKAGFVLFDFVEPCYYDNALWQFDAILIKPEIKASLFSPIRPNFDPLKYKTYRG